MLLALLLYSAVVRMAGHGGDAEAAAFSGFIWTALSCGPPWRQRRSRREFRAITATAKGRPVVITESAVFIGILGFARFHICAGSIFLSEAFFESPSISIELEIRKIRMAGCVSASRGLTNQNPYILP